MDFRTFIASVGIFALVGCSATFHLYPVHAPIIGQNPPPVIEAHITQPASQLGVISLVLPDGEACQGTWLQDIATAPSQGAQLASWSGVMDLSIVWDEVYGAGYYLAKVVGARNFGHAVLKGVKGTIIRIDFLYFQSGNTVIEVARGVAKDDKGNIYKLSL
jgi:hypothetical protein